jgi:hypothetical protein
MLKSTWEVSHESNASECVVAADPTLEPRDKVTREPNSLVRELFGRNETKESLQDDRFDSAFNDTDGENGVDTCVNGYGGPIIRNGVGGVMGRRGADFSLRIGEAGGVSPVLSMTMV